MAKEYRASDWHAYRMDWRGDPHPQMEPLEKEIEEVQKALQALAAYNILPGTRYDRDKMLLHRNAIIESFEIPWTGISPRMERLLYAINAIARPAVMVAVGIFCGNTFICNAGAAIGPGACYRARQLVGIEIDSEEALRARRNVATLDQEGQAEIVVADGTEWIAAHRGAIDLLYIDADGAYLPIVQAAARGALRRGSLVLAHNSINMAHSLARYLRYVRNPSRSLESVNTFIDDQGLEVTLWCG